MHRFCRFCQDCELRFLIKIPQQNNLFETFNFHSRPALLPGAARPRGGWTGLVPSPGTINLFPFSDYISSSDFQCISWPVHQISTNNSFALQLDQFRATIYRWVMFYLSLVLFALQIVSIFEQSIDCSSKNDIPAHEKFSLIF